MAYKIVNIMTQKRLELLKKILTIKGQLDRYVILCEDEQGRYLKYAFKEGVPHDNRCLSWYDKLQPNALKRNGHDVEEWKGKHKRTIGEIYELNQFSCGLDKLSVCDENHCSPGHPKKGCLNCHAKRWTYEEPVKCACWTLLDVDFNLETFRLDLSQIEQLIKESKLLW